MTAARRDCSSIVRMSRISRLRASRYSTAERSTSTAGASSRLMSRASSPLTIQGSWRERPACVCLERADITRTTCWANRPGSVTVSSLSGATEMCRGAPPRAASRSAPCSCSSLQLRRAQVGGLLAGPGGDDPGGGQAPKLVAKLPEESMGDLSGGKLVDDQDGSALPCGQRFTDAHTRLRVRCAALCAPAPGADCERDSTSRRRSGRH
jgi:hypothetical protein